MSLWEDQKMLNERLGGKGYSKQAAASSVYPGKKGTGDWIDSDRGQGNKAARRAGKDVKAKSPTYRAYVKNKKIKETTSLKNELIAGAQAKHQQAKTFKQFRRQASKSSLKKGEVRTLDKRTGKWRSNKG